MSKPRKIIIVVAIAAAIGAAVISVKTPKYLSDKRYVCTTCGLERMVDTKRFGPVKYHEEVTFEESPISRALKIKDCPHTWLLYSFGQNARFLLGDRNSSVDGGSRSHTLRFLIRDERFAAELARMERPSSVLRDLFTSLNSSRELDESLGEWWSDSDHPSFAVWWTTNRQLIQTALAQTNR